MFTNVEIEKYFNAEKTESFLFSGIGIVGIVLALLFFFYFKTSFYRGAAIPLSTIGLLLGVVGYTIYARSDSDRIRNVYANDMNPGELKEIEIPRMETVIKNFVMYRYIEIVLAVIGIGLFFYFQKNIVQQFWSGVGIGLFAMALLALGADYFAEKRGRIYLKGLKSLYME